MKTKKSFPRTSMPRMRNVASETFTLPKDFGYPLKSGDSYLGVFVGGGRQQSAIALGMNFDGASRQFCVQLRKGIRFMLNRPGPYLIHCYAGVDRTGFVAIVLEALMGANLREIIDDYLKSILDDEELLVPHDSPQYQRNSVVVYEILAGG